MSHLKYPSIFNTPDIAVITKRDLAAAVGFDREALVRNIEQVRPGLPVLNISAHTGEGLDDWMAFLERRAAEQMQRASAI